MFVFFWMWISWTLHYSTTWSWCSAVVLRSPIILWPTDQSLYRFPLSGMQAPCHLVPPLALSESRDCSACTSTYRLLHLRTCPRTPQLWPLMKFLILMNHWSCTICHLGMILCKHSNGHHGPLLNGRELSKAHRRNLLASGKGGSNLQRIGGVLIFLPSIWSFLGLPKVLFPLMFIVRVFIG